MINHLPDSPIDRSMDFPWGVPYGWYFVGYADELKPGDVKPLRYFEREQVLFRNEDGELGMLDAHCPHLGAHIGYGGKVQGKSVACPFHGWQFRPDGFCSAIPYAKTFPPIAKREPLLHSYPVEERANVIWAWYHPENVAPIFDVVDYPEYTDPAWDNSMRYEWISYTSPQEEAENAVDVAHFKYVHGSPGVPEGKAVYEGHIRRSRSDGKFKMVNLDGEMEEFESHVATVSNGAGQKITTLEAKLKVWLMVLLTPIKRNLTEIRFSYAFPKQEPGSEGEAEYLAYCERISGETGLLADLPIFNNKVHRTNPLIVDGDGDILRYRQWFSQFYVNEGEPQSMAAE